jgi:hypothetical protein
VALTRDFKETIQARVQRDPAFREALLKEGVECLLSGDVETGKTRIARLYQRDDWL